jgi:outer membrane protein TolC
MKNDLFPWPAALMAGVLFTFWSPLPTGALTFEEILAGIDGVLSVQSAGLERIAAEQRLDISEYPGDPSFTLTPETSLVTEETDAFPTRTELSATASVDIPLGLSRDRQLAAQTTAAALVRARETEAYARAAAYGDLLSAYRAAWLAQRELEVLEKEYDAAAEAARTAQDRFQRGTASLREVNTADDDLVAAQIALREGMLERRLRSLELLYAAGLERSMDEHLEPPPDSLPDLPRPPVLTAWAVENDPQMRTLTDSVAAFRRDINALDGVAGSPVVRAGFSGWDQSASVAFNTASPSVTLAYGAPLYTSGTLSESRGSSSDVDTWELSFSIALPLQTTGSSTRGGALLDTSVEQTLIDAREREGELALEIRSRYQQYELSRETIQDARRSIDLARDVLETVTQRYESDRTTREDLLLAEAHYHRSLYRLDAALAAREEAKIATASAASYLHILTGMTDR